MAHTRVEPAVSFGASQRSWVTDLMNHVSDHGGIRVVGTVLTHDDAIGMEFDVLVIDDVSSVLSPRLVDRMHADGRIVVGVYDADRAPEARERLLQMGCDGLVSSDASAGEFVRSVVDTVRQHSIDHQFADLMGESMPADDEVGPTSVPDQGSAGPGRVVVVAGSNGVTEVVVGLAANVAGRRSSVVVVDMDTVEPSVSQRLGLPLTPNIFTATEHLRLRGDLSDAFISHADGFAVVGGIPSPREWENLSETEAADLVGELAGGFDVVLVKINRCLEDLASFAGTAGRFDVGRRLAASANHIVAVTSASPLGMSRLLAMLSDLRLLASAPTSVVVNQAPSNQFVQGEISEELTRTFSPASLTFLPYEGRVRKAAWQGELVRGGAFMRRLGKLADEVVTAGAGRAVGRAGSDGSGAETRVPPAGQPHHSVEGTP